VVRRARHGRVALCHESHNYTGYLDDANAFARCSRISQWFINC